MGKKHKTKTHQKINGQLLQMNKRFSNLKNAQKEKITAWLYEEYRAAYKEKDMPPDTKRDIKILLNVTEKIEAAQIWLPGDELDKHYYNKKAKFGGRYEKEKERELMKRPIIGVMPLIDYEKDSYWLVPGYMQGIIEAGGTPVMLPLTDNIHILNQIAQKCDGFLLTGGQDVSPSLYGENDMPKCGECSVERDNMETMLIKRAIELNKPILGICRGIQILNFVLGGTLYQDLPTQIHSSLEHHQKPPYDKPVHDVEIIKDTPLYSVLEKDILPVNSYHHQAIKDLSDKLLPMAKAPDGLIEAVYMPNKKFVWGVQWHPEFSYISDNDSKMIFAEFVRQSK